MKMSVRGELVFIWFVLGYGLYYLTGTYIFLPVMIFAAPIFILHLLEKQELFEAWIFSFIGFVLTVQLSTLPFLNYEGAAWWYSGFLKNFLIAAGVALPYWLTRLVYHRNCGFVYTIVFPVFTTSVYFILSKTSVFSGVSGFSHYLQADNKWMIQLASLGGIWVIVFIISWASSIVCWIWNNGVNSMRSSGGIILFLFICFILVFYGNIRISSINSSSKYSNNTVRIAAVGMSEKDDYSLDKIFRHENRPVYEKQLETIEKRAEEAAMNECRVVVFPEYAFFVNEDEDKGLRDELSRISKDNKVYVVLGYFKDVTQNAAEDDSSDKIHDSLNKGISCVLMFDVTGEIVAEYHKKSLYKEEKPYVYNTEGTISIAATPFGNIALLSRKDMDYAYNVKNAVSRNADIVICSDLGYVPDKAGIHSMIGRSVENGFSIVNISYNGLSYAIDSYGRIRNIVGAGKVLYADVPLKRVNNVYGAVGDFFAWIIVVLSCVFLVNVFFPFFNF
ncbi:MAG: hypothetical protein JXK07_03895 [Spirochaetes bacterium]|nr:hypothetical protein [Spirochaetota bacterium]MBN2770337.1 hypothetical protein [Spirochaetota bacterium]